MGFENDISPEDEGRRGLLRSRTKGLAFSTTINSAQPDPFRRGVVQSFDGGTIEDSDDGAREVSSSITRNTEQRGESKREPTS